MPGKHEKINFKKILSNVLLDRHFIGLVGSRRVQILPHSWITCRAKFEIASTPPIRDTILGTRRQLILSLHGQRYAGQLLFDGRIVKDSSFYAIGRAVLGTTFRNRYYFLVYTKT